MANFKDKLTRPDPYKNFKFLVKFDGRVVAGVSKISPLKRTVFNCKGGTTTKIRKSPKKIEYDPITLERGVTHDLEFVIWVEKVWNSGSELGSEVSLKDYRKDIVIYVLNEAGQKVIAYKIFRCWVSEYQTLPDMNANSNAVGIQHIKLENEGWERVS